MAAVTEKNESNIETIAAAPSPHFTDNDISTSKVDELEAHEIFKKDANGVQFRTVSWIGASVIFTKIQFAMSILAVPACFATLGAVGGGISIIAWTTLNTYTAAYLLGDFRHNHPDCHTLADMMGVAFGRIGRELVVVQLIVAQILISAAGIVSTSSAFNAVSVHSQCTVVFALISAILITICSSIRTFSKLGWLTWLGFVTFLSSVFIFAVGVSLADRPAAAPQTGDFDLGFKAVATTGFILGMVQSSNLFICTSGSSMYIPVISEMRRPQDYRKAALAAGIVNGILYFGFGLWIYRYCGIWLSTPAFGSAGTLIKKISYGVAMPGLVIGVGIYQHVSAKYVFVRILRNSKHLQENTFVHWATWIGTNLALGAVSFIISQAVPILNYLLGLAAALCFAPFSLIFPVLLWEHDFKTNRTDSVGKKARHALHWLIALLGLFMVAGGTYAVAEAIKMAFASGQIAKVFDCADNSGSVQLSK